MVENYGELLYRDDVTDRKRMSKYIAIAFSFPFIGMILFLIFNFIIVGYWPTLLLTIFFIVYLLIVWSEYSKIKPLEIWEQVLITPKVYKITHPKNVKNYKNGIILFDQIQIFYPNICEKKSKKSLAMPDGQIEFKSEIKKNKFLQNIEGDKLDYCMIKMKDGCYICIDNTFSKEAVTILEELTTVSRNVIMMIQKPPGAL